MGWRAEECAEVVEFCDVPGDHDEHGCERGERDLLGDGGEQEHEEEDDEGVCDAGERGFASAFDVCGCACDGACCREPEEE